MGRGEKLEARQLTNRCDPSGFAFATTEELEDLTQVIGQSRAVDAIDFGIGIRRPGYNLFAMGPPDSGKHAIVRRFLDERGSEEAVPADWCYVNNFEQEHRPRCLKLPAGRAAELSRDLDRLLEDLRVAIPAAFEAEEYRARRQELETAFNERQEKALEEIRGRAQEQGIALIRTPTGIAFAPLRDGEVLDPKEFQKLPEEERRRLQESVAGFEEELGQLLHQVPRWRREAQRRVKELDQLVTRTAVDSLMDELIQEHEGIEVVRDHLLQVKKDVIENVDAFRKAGEQPALFGVPLPQATPDAALRRYRVNVLMDHGASSGAPVVYEDNPTYPNLVGRSEHASQMGTLVTDFTLIKPGALHRANGGYLILDAIKVIAQPYAWEGLKRALRSREIRTESLGQALSLISTISLEPEPIPLDVKVILVGDRVHYYMLHQLDPEFRELFKVSVDFEERMGRDGDGDELYARLLGTLARQEKLRHLDATAVARVIEESSRQAGDAEKLSVELHPLTDLLREADYWAGRAQRRNVTAADVEKAVESRERRLDRVRQRLQEEIQRGTILIDTDGEKIGQVNALSVLQLGGFSFGRPNRITARVRLGGGKVVDIEREVDLGGPLHSKGVLILSGFLAGRYVSDRPLSLSASLVFEQSYGGVDGDSASSAELYALLSALAESPLKQSLAVTGSVNQHGEVQAIGGVNEKIEGYFDICRARGLSGDQGVLIPAANKKHLMLRHDVIEAVEAGRFHVYVVRDVDEGLEVLTGRPAGRREADGSFTEGSVNAAVEARLLEFARKARAFKAKKGGTGNGGEGDGEVDGGDTGGENSGGNGDDDTAAGHDGAAARDTGARHGLRP
jgi:lon-related putative ATP-dependent protease